MKIQQLSIFLENRSGHLDAACKAMADAGINILTLTLADTRDFGILRVIVKDHDSAKSVLEEKGFTVKVTEMLAAEIKDEPGGLHRILEAAGGAGLNVEYMYAFANRSEDSAVLLLRFDKPDLALEALQKAGVNMISRSDLFDENC